MSGRENLKFDKMVVDTTLAQEYFKNKENKFTCIYNGVPIELVKATDYILDKCNNKIYCIDTVNTVEFIEHVAERDSKTVSDSLRQLAKNIDTNGELFCQLEYALRNHPIDDVNKALFLLISKCLHLSSLVFKYPSIRCTSAPAQQIGGDGPLYYLSRAVLCLGRGINVIIRAPPQVAAVCTLFVELCLKVGFKNISLQLTRDEGFTPDLGAINEGCVGVVSETADLDSAVHAFTSSTTIYPWRLNSILVQESVYEDFQRALKWRCNVNIFDEEDHEPHLKQLSSDAQVTDGKIFLIDYLGVGTIRSTLHPIVLTAYRTNKELLKIMSKHEEPFVSLWCTDSSHANEIAFSISSSCVWINSYAVFNVSPQNPTGVPVKYAARSQKNQQRDELKRKWEENNKSWLKHHEAKRREMLLLALKEYIESSADVKEALKIEALVRTQRIGYVEVNNNDMWIGIEKPTGCVCVNESDFNEHFVDAVASMVYGNVVVLNDGFQNINSFIKHLQKAGLPLYQSKFEPNALFRIYEIRAIYSNFGTTFAN